LEYQSTYDLYDFNFKWSNLRNRAARDTDVPEFICPTAPTPGERSVESPPVGAPNWSYTDYAVNGRIAPSAVCVLLATGVKDRPDWQHFFTGVPEYEDFDPSGCPPGNLKKQTGITTFKQITDGTSHTIMFSPDAARPDKYQDGVKVPSVTNVTGSRWASTEPEFWSHNICAGGRSIMNCNNDNEVYSFHVGGGNFSFGDGSVQFLREDLDIEVQVSLNTRAGEDVYSLQ
jgi:prepilin-type processing-associated H-X9-DG protein